MQAAKVHGLNELQDLIQTLSSEQAAQIERQIKYHFEAPPHEDLPLNEVISLRFAIDNSVTRPMSSKGLAKWLWSRPALYYQRRVLDIGTGCGIQGITCLLGGADYAVLTDVSEQAAQCAASNLLRSGLGARADIRVSDLFDELGEAGRFDLIVFAQPYFVGSPIPQYPFTRGMLADRDLLPRFFCEARTILAPGGRIALMGWSFAGRDSDPVVIGPQCGFTQVSSEIYRDNYGIQQGEFHIVLFE